MNSTIVTLNDWARNGQAFAWPVLWQSSVLIGLMFGLELGLRRKVRPALRYGFWLVILLKLLLPPSLALPSGVAWWVRPSAPNPPIHKQAAVLVRYGAGWTDALESPKPALLSEAPPAFSLAARGLLAWAGVSFGLLAWILIRWRQVARQADGASAAPDWLLARVADACAVLGCPRRVRVKVLEKPESPAVSGLFHPILLVPRQLIEQLAPAEIRAVLLHELIHLRRLDVWVNCAQALLQVVYWWHPLLWLANARIRRVREEAVDDAVMLALRNDSDTYAPTLLAVAKLAMRRPVMSLGIVGILEPHSSLRRRIERLVDFHPPAKAGLTLVSSACLLAFAALALPMGQAPPGQQRDLPAVASVDNPWPDPRFAGYAEIKLEPQFLVAGEAGLRLVLPSLIDADTPLVCSSNQLAEIKSQLRQANAQPYTSTEPFTFAQFSGGRFTWLIGGVTNNGVNYLTRDSGAQRNVVMGAEARFLATQPEWLPLELTVVPWSEGSNVHCQIQFGLADDLRPLQQAEATIPPAGALLWATVTETNPRQYEIVLLEVKSGAANQEAPAPATGSGPTNEPATTGLAVINLPNTETLAGDLATLRQFLTNSTASHPFNPATNAAVVAPDSPVGSWKLKAIFANNGGQPLAIINQGAYRVGDEIQGHKIINITSNEVWFQGARSQERLGFDMIGAGKLFFHRGELSRAGAQFEKVLLNDPSNQAAHYYLDQVRRASYARLGERRLQRVSFNHTPLREVLLALTQYARDPNSGKDTVDFYYTQDPDDIGDVPITLQPSLVDVSLLDVVEAVAKVAPTPLKFSINSMGVVFARKLKEAVALYTRIIKLNPATFNANLRSANGDYRTGAPGPDEVRKFFAGTGVDLTPPRLIFFNDREGTLLVRTTRADLDKIERLVVELNQEKAQINIKTKFVIAPLEFSASLRRAVGRTNALSSSTSSFSAVLTSAQAAVLVKACESSAGDILSEASVTTLAGRETQVQTIDLKTIVTNINPRALALPGISSPELNGDLFQTTTLPCGPILNVVPLMQPDGLHMQLVTDVQLRSYSEVTNEVPIYVEGKRRSIAVPSPRLQVAKAAANVLLSEGQSLLLEAEMVDEPSPSSSASGAKTCLLVLVRPVIISPDGNPLHPEPTGGQPGFQK